MQRNLRVCAIALVSVSLVLLFAGLPSLAVFRSYSSATGHLGLEAGKRIEFVYVDKTHFEAYKTALFFDKSLSITGRDGVMYCNGEEIEFPDGANVALVRSPGDVVFVELDEKYFQEHTGRSEVVYLFWWKLPHFKDRSKGMLDLERVKRDQVIQEEWAHFLDIR